MYILEKNASSWDLISFQYYTGGTINVSLLGLSTPQYIGGKTIDITGITQIALITNDNIKIQIPTSGITTQNMHYLEGGEGIITISTSTSTIKDKFKIK
jgi:hypothetical protein